MESNYIKCSVSQPLNFVKQHGLRALLLGFFDCSFTLFLPRLQQLPIFLKKGCFQTLLPQLKQIGYAWLTTRSIYLFSFQAQPSTVYLASCIIHIAQKTSLKHNHGSENSNFATQ